MNLFVSHTSAGPMLTLPESLTVPVITEVHQEFMKHPDVHKQITADLSHCNSIDASGVQWLLQIARYLQSADGELVLAGIPDNVEDTIRILGATELLEAHGNPASMEVDHAE